MPVQSGYLYRWFLFPNALASDFQLLNIDNIQVLEGPQGTLFGHNTTGGAILVTTAQPSFDRSGMLDVSYGNYNTQRYEGYFTTGLTDHIAFDVAGLLTKGDGYVHDIVTGSNTDGAYQNWTIRAGLRADVTDKISLLFHYEHTETNDPTNYLLNAYVANGVPQVAGAVWNAVDAFDIAHSITPPFPPSIYATKPHDVADEGAQSFHAKSDVFQLASTFDLDFATLTSYTQYRTLSAETTNLNIFMFAVPLPAVYSPAMQVDLDNKDGRTITQEFLLNSNSEGRLKWTAGAFYLDYTDSFFTTDGGCWAPRLPTPPLTVGADTISLAVYGDATYQVLDDLYLSAGLRYSHDEIQDAYYSNFIGPTFSPPSSIACPSPFAILYCGVNPNVSGDSLSPRAVLRYTPNDHSSVYFSFSRGTKSAVANVGPASITPAAKPETIDAYEVGYKYAGHELSFDLSSYYYDYKDLQID